MDTLAHLGHAYKALGLHEKAQSLFTESLPVLEKSGDRHRNALFLSHLSDIHLTLGELKDSVTFMERAIQEARAAGQPAVLADILNNAANLLVADGNIKDAVATYQESLGIIKEAGGMDELRAKVLLNMARVHLSVGDLPAMAQTMETAAGHIKTLPDAYAKADNLITLALLMRDAGNKEENAELRQNAWESLKEAGRISEALKDLRILSRVYGHMGELYEDEGRYEEALGLTRSAVFFAQQMNSLETLYRWHWQMGRIFKSQGNIEDALQAYQRAVGTLDPIRIQLFRGHRWQKDHFNEHIRPVYIGLADIYLTQADALSDPKAREAKLKHARDTMEVLKTAELQNFFNDECVTAMAEDKVSLDRTPPHTAVVYPIPLEDRLAVLISLPESMTHFNIPVDAQKLRQTARRFRMTEIQNLRQLTAMFQTFGFRICFGFRHSDFGFCLHSNQIYRRRYDETLVFFNNIRLRCHHADSAVDGIPSGCGGSG